MHIPFRPNFQPWHAADFNWPSASISMPCFCVTFDLSLGTALHAMPFCWWFLPAPMCQIELLVSFCFISPHQPRPTDMSHDIDCLGIAKTATLACLVSEAFPWDEANISGEEHRLVLLCSDGLVLCLVRILIPTMACRDAYRRRMEHTHGFASDLLGLSLQGSFTEQCCTWGYISIYICMCICVCVADCRSNDMERPCADNSHQAVRILIDSSQSWSPLSTVSSSADFTSERAPMHNLVGCSLPLCSCFFSLSFYARNVNVLNTGEMLMKLIMLITRCSNMCFIPGKC